MDKIRVLIDDGAFMPERAHELDAGYDLRTPTKLFVPAHGYAVVNTGVHMEIPAGYVGMLKSKSGLNVKYDLTGEGVIDAGYSGAIVVKLYNHGYTDFMFEPGDKLIQLVIVPVLTPELEQTNQLWDSERGVNGFGSSGK